VALPEKLILPVKKVSLEIGVPSSSARLRCGLAVTHLSRQGTADDRNSSVRFDHLLRMLPRRLGQLGSGQHARHFFGAFFAGDLADGGFGAASGFALFDDVVVVGEGGNLGQVGYTENLIAFRKRF